MMKRTTMVLALVLAFGLTGCMEELPVTSYPAFYAPGRYQVLGIRSFEGATAVSQRVGDVLAGELAVAMLDNGTYPEVYNLGQRHMLPEIDLMLVGTVEHFSAERLTRTEQQQAYTVDAEGNRTSQGLQERFLTANDVTLTVSARIETPDGAILQVTAEPITAHVRSDEGDASTPLMSLEECYYRAIREVSAELVRQFAITEGMVSVVGEDTFFIAAGRDLEGNWVRSNTFSIDTPALRVVVKLPPEADRNVFQLVIIAKNKPDTPLKREVFVWRREDRSTGQVFVFVPLELLTQAGTGQLQVQLRSGDTPILRRDLTITESATPVDLPADATSELVPTTPAD